MLKIDEEEQEKNRAGEGVGAFLLNKQYKIHYCLTSIGGIHKEGIGDGYTPVE